MDTAMGFKLQDKIQKMRGIPGKYKRILTAIANRARNDGTNFFEAKETIGAKSGVDRSTAFRNMEELTEIGILPKAGSHECGIDYCPKGSQHFYKPGNHWTQAYYIDLVALQKYDESRCKMLREKKKSGVAKRTRVALQNATEVALHFEMQTGDTREARFTGSVEPSVLTDGSEKASESVSLATTSLASPVPSPASPERQNLSGCGDLTSEEQNQKQNQPQTLQELVDSDEFFSDAVELLYKISPNVTDAMVKEQLPLCARILEFFSRVPEKRYRVMAADMVVRWNRTHRSGKYATKDDKKLYIRTAAQFLKALESDSASLMNDYDGHQFDQCELCKAQGGMHYHTMLKELREEEKQREAQKRAEEAHRKETERLAKLCGWCKKNPYGSMSLKRGTDYLNHAIMVRVCNACYDEQYESLQSGIGGLRRNIIDKRPGYVTKAERAAAEVKAAKEAKRKAEAEAIAKKMEDAECDVPICPECAQVTYHAKSCSKNPNRNHGSMEAQMAANI